MKTKFQKMTRQEKKDLINKFKGESEKNKRYMRTLNEMLIIGILGTIYGAGNLLLDYLVLHVKLYAYILDGIVLAFGIVLIIQRTKFKNAVLNHYAITGQSAVPAAEVKKEEVKEEPKKRKHVSKNAQAKKDAKKVEKKAEPAKKETKKAPAKKTTTKKTTAKKTTTKKTTKKTK